MILTAIARDFPMMKATYLYHLKTTQCQILQDTKKMTRAVHFIRETMRNLIQTMDCLSMPGHHYQSHIRENDRDEGVIFLETKHRQTLESSRDPAESERTLCRDGRASTGSESQCRLPPSGIPELYSGGCTQEVGSRYEEGSGCWWSDWKKIMEKMKMSEKRNI